MSTFLYVSLLHWASPFQASFSHLFVIPFPWVIFNMVMAITLGKFLAIRMRLPSEGLKIRRYHWHFNVAPCFFLRTAWVFTIIGRVWHHLDQVLARQRKRSPSEGLRIRVCVCVCVCALRTATCAELSARCEGSHFRVAGVTPCPYQAFLTISSPFPYHFLTNCYMCRIDSKMWGIPFGVVRVHTMSLPIPYHCLTIS